MTYSFQFFVFYVYAKCIPIGKYLGNQKKKIQYFLRIIEISVKEISSLKTKEIKVVK